MATRNWIMMKLGKLPFFTAAKVYAIADIHNNATKLRKILAKIKLKLTPQDHIVFLGDLIDGGEDFFEVLEIIRNLKLTYPGQVFIIEGNHEEMMINFLTPWSDEHEIKDKDLHLATKFSNSALKKWERHHGTTSLRCLIKRYGTDDFQVILKGLKEDNLWQIFTELIPYYENESLFLSHAPLTEKGWEALQNPILDKDYDFLAEQLRGGFGPEIDMGQRLGKTLVCGHQHSQRPEPLVLEQTVYLDADSEELFCYVWPSKELISS